MSNHRVLIVAGDPLARAGLAALLGGIEGVIVAGQTAPGSDLALEIYRPDVALWDTGWESGPLPEVEEGGPPVIALVPDASGAAEAWLAGARGLLRRDCSLTQLSAAVEAAACGLAVLDPALASALPLARTPAAAEALTPREQDVLRLLVEGLPNKAIARQLAISEHTVKFHLNAILAKLGAQSRTEAVVQAIRLGLITV